MKWVAAPKALRPMHFEIKRDQKVGYYLFVFKESKCIKDYLQDTLDLAMEEAQENFGVNPQDWNKVD